jgi:predicted outer membrane repeat protein
MNSTFVNNRVGGGYGGAIDNYGTMSVMNSTFTGNHAVLSQYWEPGGSGGAIANYGTLSIVNSTLSGNTADVSGGGIYNEGIVTLTNSIIANSVTGGNCSGSFIDGGYNLEDTNTCGFSPTLHSLISTTAMLGPLQVNPPGLAIPTMALLFGSPAINAGDDAACPPTDERGVHRPIGPHCDIGAYEAFNRLWLFPVMRK